MKQPKERSIKSVVLIVRIKKKLFYYLLTRTLKNEILKMNEELIEEKDE